MGLFNDFARVIDKLDNIGARPIDFINTGVDQFKRGDFTESVNSFMKAIDDDPSSIEYVAPALKSLFEKYSREKAPLGVQYIAVISSKVGIKCRQIGEPEVGIAFFDYALFCYENISGNLVDQMYPRWMILSNKANSLKDLGRYDEAIQCYNHAIELNKNSTILINKGVTLVEMGKFEEALAIANEILIREPTNHDALELTQLISINKKSGGTYEESLINDGINFANLGHFSEARTSYDKAIAINSNNGDTWFNRGVALERLGQYSEAVASYDRTISINPNDADAWVNRGNALIQLGQYSEAISSYDKAIAIKQGYATAWYNRGNALYKLGQYSEAVASYDKAIAINSNYAEPWSSRGVALERLGQYSEAVASYDKAIAINPNYDLAIQNRKLALKKQS